MLPRFTSQTIFQLPQSVLLPLNALSTSRNQLKLSLPALTTVGQWQEDHLIRELCICLTHI